MQKEIAEEEELESQFLQKIVQGSLALAWRKTIEALSMGDIDGAKNGMRLMAGTTGDDNLTDTLKGWLVKVQSDEEVLRIGHYLSEADKEAKHKKVHRELLPRYFDIYDDLLALMRERKYITFDLLKAKPYKQGVSKW